MPFIIYGLGIICLIVLGVMLVGVLMAGAVHRLFGMKNEDAPAEADTPEGQSPWDRPKN